MLHNDDVEWNENCDKLKNYKDRFGHFPKQTGTDHDEAKKLGRWYHIQRSLLQLWYKPEEYFELKDWIATGEYKYHGIIHGQEQIATDRYNKMLSIGALSNENPYYVGGSFQGYHRPETKDGGYAV